jgi:hypothetical protein
VLPKCAKTRGEDLSGRLGQFAARAELQQSQQHASDYSTVAKSPAAPSSIPLGTAKLVTNPTA